MLFKDYPYERINIEQFKQKFLALITKFNQSTTFEEQEKVLADIYVMRRRYVTMSDLVYVRNSIDTTDAFYEGEMDHFNEINAIYEGLVSKFYKALVATPYRKQLETKWGKQLFDLAQMQLKTFDDAITKDLQTESRLVTQYRKLIASAKIMFNGEERNLSQMRSFLEAESREVRKAASEKVSGFFKENEQEFDRLYDELVKVRTKMAKTLGYENYIELGYARMSRTDYDKHMVANYRKQIKDVVVPIASALREKQRERLGLSELYFYDEKYSFLTGNPTPKGDAKWMVENAAKMYKDLSTETDAFFQFMVEHELLDLESKKGKASGGYCLYLPDFKSPFIFANFNGTAGDVDVLTHEAGHAFQVFQSRKYPVSEYYFPTYEACEIHSMSMEFLTFPWMENFFKEDTEKYKYLHLVQAVLFFPYGVTVDEFQHWVYENSDATPNERKEAWKEIEGKYLPHRDYHQDTFLEKGTFWFRQGHIYSTPFYYIDYTLAQLCALQFYQKANENREKAWADYLNLCNLGGSQSFLQLIKQTGLKNPFEDGAVSSVMKPIVCELEKVNDKNL